ncbi:MAG: Maf-like protein [Saccharospirillaceae bacterium]|nr:Maf-like protein [Saccharospirillaceae bacterium]MCD8532485.1 Maf-like protein [Saccharospirillaceae bacterium]
MSQLILASASPRRRELLQQIGVKFRVDVADIDETPLLAEPPAAYVARLALDKARKVAAENPGFVVLGSDTTVVLDNGILGKPENDADAVRILTALSGRCHQVMTAVALVNDEQQRVQTVVTNVHFAPLSRAQINAYVATGEPADKAGAYGIQGLGAVLVDAIEGSYSNVVGLPLTETAALLQAFNIPIWDKD